MSQSRRMSGVEALVSTCVGLVYAFSLNLFIAHVYNAPMTARYSAILTFWMTIASVLRTYVMRRFFEWFPRWWRQLWCKHRFAFIDTTTDDEIVQECVLCEHRVKDTYVA